MALCSDRSILCAIMRYMNFAENAVLYIDACNGMTTNAKYSGNQWLKKQRERRQPISVGQVLPIMMQARRPPVLSSIVCWELIRTSTLRMAPSLPKTPSSDHLTLRKFLMIWEIFTVGRYPLGVSRYGGRVAYYSVNRSEIILTPSIEYFTLDEYESRMRIKGLFGDYNSSDVIVMVGGCSAPIILWSNESSHVRITYSWARVHR